MEKSGVHYFNMFKIAYSRAGWVLSTLRKTGHISAAQYNEVIGRFK